MVFKKIKKLLPVRLKDKIKRCIYHSWQGEKKHFCPVCNCKLSRFNRISDCLVEQLDNHSFIHSIFQFETLNFLNYTCPNCGSSDRARLYVLYFKKNNHLFRSNTGSVFRFLDIAPDPGLSHWIKGNLKVNYRSADLLNQTADDRVDITDLNIYPDNSFDFVLCSHVLEHVDDDVKAISEIHRVLQSGSKAIVMVPILLNLESDFENPDFRSDSERWKYFGQNDHVRLYSKQGFIDKLTNSGFTVYQFGVEYFGSEVLKLHGINEKSVLYVAEKTLNTTHDQ